jgi:hypothetical protein
VSFFSALNIFLAFEFRLHGTARKIGEDGHCIDTIV